MANVITTLNDHIRRLALREIRGQSKAIRRATAQFRRDIAALKRLVKSLQERLSSTEKGKRPVASRIVALEPAPDNVRFRADGLRTHRAKLGLSARDYGKLAGVSALTIYHWENGKSKPRRKQLAGLLAARKLGKREALKLLED